jgi:CelD/BcsL family acetyltransferase involved in cellulose biosynthesis
MRVTFSDDGRDFQRRDWTRLVASDPSGTFFHTPAYLKLYWEEFGEGPEQLLLAFADDDAGEQVGAAAFELAGRTLRFLGGTEVTDYMGPVARDGEAGAVAKELFAALSRRDDWSEADLRGLPDDGNWAGPLRDAAGAHGCTVEVMEDPNGVAPYLPLPRSWDAYLAGLPAKLRHEIKRKARKLASDGGAYRIVHSTPDALGADLDRFVELHRSSEGPKGVFMQPGMEIFFRRLGEAFLPAGMFRLDFLEIERVKVAGTIGFDYERRAYLYNSAFDHEWRALSPGMVLVAEDVRAAIERGCEGFDLLKGDYEYKYRFGAYPRRIERLVIRR